MIRQSKRPRLQAAGLLLGLLVFSGCQIDRNLIPAYQKIEQQDALKAQFRDNLSAFAPNSNDEKDILAVLRDGLQMGLAGFDLDRLETHLGQKFQRITFVNKERAVAETRAGFLAARQAWRDQRPPARRVAFSVRDITVRPNRRQAHVLAFSTYATKFFTPRFMESMVFTKSSGKWKLIQSTLVPVHPRSPAAYEVDILLAEPVWSSKGRGSFANVFAATAISKGPDHVIGQFKNASFAKLPANTDLALLFVFRQPPPPGSVVTTEIIYHQSYGSFPFSFDNKVEESHPFFVIENRTYLHDGSGSHATVNVFLDGKILVTKKILFK